MFVVTLTTTRTGVITGALTTPITTFAAMITMFFTSGNA